MIPARFVKGKLVVDKSDMRAAHRAIKQFRDIKRIPSIVGEDTVIELGEKRDAGYPDDSVKIGKKHYIIYKDRRDWYGFEVDKKGNQLGDAIFDPRKGELKKMILRFQEDAVKAAKDRIKREKEADKVKHDAMLDRARLQKAQNKNRATESLDDQFESLWANIHKKRKEGRPMRKKGEKGAPTDDAFRRAKNEEYGAGEEGTDGLVKKYKEDTPGEDCTCFDHVISEAEYQGRKVKLNDPMRSNDGKKKFYVYTKNEKGNIVKVGFGDPNMEIKRDDPGRRKNFRARHNCDNPGPKWKARYWSCYQWRAGAKVDN
jgi:hypothetical protein